MKRTDFVRQPVDVWAPQIRELLTSVGDVAYVAGGAARELVMRDEAPPSWDIDLFQYRPGDVDIDVIRETLRRIGYHSEEQTQRSYRFTRNDGELEVQIIAYYRDAHSLTSGAPEDVLAHFSFTAEMFAIVPGAGSAAAIIGSTAIDDVRSRMLVVQNVTDPLVVALRAVKYGYKRFGIAPEQLQIVFDAYMKRAGET